MPSVHSTFAARTAVASIAIALLAPGLARAQSKDTTAESLFTQAQERMAQRDLTAACDLFAKSLAVDAALGTLLNLAACHEKQGKTATAWSEFSAAEAQATRSGDGPRAQFARLHLAGLEKGLHRVVIEIMSPAPGMHVTLDGPDLAREAWGTALPLDPGEHRLDVVADAGRPFARNIDLGPSSGHRPHRGDAGAGRRADPASGAALDRDPRAPRPPLRPARAWMRPTGFAVGGLGVVGLGVAVAFGAEMANHTSARDRLCPPGTPCGDQSAFCADHAARVDQQWMFVSGGSASRRSAPESRW